MATKDPLDGTEPSNNVVGRPPALKPEHIAVLHDIVKERAQASLQESPPSYIADARYASAMQRFVVRYVRKASYGSSQFEGVHGTRRGRQTVWLHGSSPTRGRIAVQYHPDRRRMELVADLFKRVPGQRGSLCIQPP